MCMNSLYTPTYQSNFGFSGFIIIQGQLDVLLINIECVDNGQACEHKDAPRQAKYKRVEVYNSGWRIRKGWYICIFLNRTLRHCNHFVKCHVLPCIFYFVFLLLFVQKVLVCMVF